MIVGAHSILFSSNADADREFFRDALGMPHVDVGGGWLIFGLPPAEVAFHPGEGGSDFYLMCDDVESFIADMQVRDVECAEVKDEGWGLVTQITLPSGSKLSVYEPRHARPELPASKAKAAKRTAKKKAGKRGASKAKKPAATVARKPAKKKAAKKAGKAKRR